MSRWRQLRTAAAAYWVSSACKFAIELPSLDCTSQRAEIFALAAALSHTEGEVSIATDCLNVYNIFRRLQAKGFSTTGIVGLWCVIMLRVVNTSSPSWKSKLTLASLWECSGRQGG